MNTAQPFHVGAVPKAELHGHAEGAPEPAMLLDFARRRETAVPDHSMAQVLSAYRFQHLRSLAIRGSKAAPAGGLRP